MDKMYYVVCDGAILTMFGYEPTQEHIDGLAAERRAIGAYDSVWVLEGKPTGMRSQPKPIDADTNP
jgi:hypothetical protein